ncbi:hypothetical protein SPOG_01825 [Schizosaccharomyces cryophilus OY26]|uniref:Uncharacterized protein n=1 Tax=Schizosaccharomyces cryophilus (strain OY26 / ATCC MYA-4695 / CBS 11777 / NBRC 106824 / NRRL Y48691) TaxID=653667 RepID=S9VY16_SCHCR|nr:uncharacterized protein SPOG_01825 [Schizosaccharomyces cryophilus OY26]EPY52503.1 hypothetical protein SPOG_01825 [Schizosaccharomyces cryophilus OY26]
MGWSSCTVRGDSLESPDSHLNFFTFNREKSLRCSSLHQSFTASSPDVSPQMLPRCMNYQHRGLPSDVSMMEEDTVKIEYDRDDDMEPVPTSQIPLSPVNVSTPERNTSVYVKSANWNVSSEFSKNYSPRLLKESYLVSPTRRSLKNLSPGLRRKSLLPKPKMFQRVANALYEEASPWEIEVRGESEFAKMTSGSTRVPNSQMPSSHLSNPVHSSTLHLKGKPQECPSNARKEKDISVTPTVLAEPSSPVAPMEKSHAFFSPAALQTPKKRAINGSNSQSPKSLFTSPLHKEKEFAFHSKKRSRWSEEFADLSKRRAVSPSLLYKFNATKFSPVHSVKVGSLQVRDTHEVLRNLKLY